jgi:hypothetical protein
MAQSTENLSIVSIQAQVTDLLSDIRRGLAVCGVETGHLDDHQLYELISWAYYQLEVSGQPMTREAWFAAMGIVSAPEEVRS